MEKSLLFCLLTASAFTAPLIIRNDPPPAPEKEVVEEEQPAGGVVLKRLDQPVLEPKEITQNYFELVEEEERDEAGPNSSFLR